MFMANHQAFIHKLMKQYSLVEGAEAFVGHVYIALFASEIEAGTLSEKVFELKQVLFEQLLSTLRKPESYESRQVYLRQISSFLPQFTMALVAASVVKSKRLFLLQTLELLHKQVLLAVPDTLILDAIDLAKSQKLERENQHGASLVGREVRLPLSGKSTRGQLAAFRQASRVFVVTNIAGKKLVEIPYDEFISQLEDGCITLGEPVDRFDQALEAVIDGLRQG